MKTHPIISKLLFTLTVLCASILSSDAQTDRVGVVRVPGVSKVFKAQRDKAGTIHLVFDSDESPRVTASFLSGKLYTMSSRDDGKTFSQFAEINPRWNPCDCCTTATAYGSDGKVAVLYREETNNDRDIYLALWNPNNSSTPTRTRVSATSWSLNACPMTYFTIAPTDTGYVVAWPTKGQIYFARLDKSGTVLPPGEIKTPGANGMRTGVVALNAKNGATLVAWKNKETLGWHLPKRMSLASFPSRLVSRAP